jgi:peptidoglycan/xylan/chitin deacetylase (PgdA/CDA1 family)
MNAVNASIYYRWSAAVALLFVLLGGYVLLAPRQLLTLAAFLKPGALYFVRFPTSSEPAKIVALTIDDGPSAATASILAVLARYGVKATFFNISGHLPGNEAAMRQTVAEGHEIGNHLTADEASYRLSPSAFEADLLSAEKALLPYLNNSQNNAQTKLRWLRPGMGWYSHTMVKTAERHGYRLALGSVFPYDTSVLSSSFSTAFILKKTQPCDIIVLHDGPERGRRTAQTLAKVLPALQAQGYTVTTLTDLTSAALGDQI